MENFNRLPSDIVLDIITRLPAESVLDSKLVCKPWRDLVSHHPAFYQMYSSHLNQSTDDSGKLGFLVLNKENDDYYYFEYNNDEATAAGRIRRINLKPPIPYAGSEFEIFGLSNGLVCLFEYLYETVYICNPLAREYVKLPDFNRDWVRCRRRFCRTRGFGYLPLTNEYKVVEIYELDADENIVEVLVLVYTLGRGNGWRNVGRFDIQSHNSCLGNGTFVNGALHWLNYEDGRVTIFDLTEEKFCQHVSPPPLPPGSWCLEYHSIGVLGGFFYYAARYFNSIGYQCYDIYPIKGKNDNGDTIEQLEQETLGWNKEFVYDNRKPFAFTKSAGVLYFDYGSFGIYDARSSTSKELVHFSSFVEIYPHKNTLVSLKELGEHDAVFC